MRKPSTYADRGETSAPGLLPSGNLLVVLNPDDEEAVEMTPEQVRDMHQEHRVRDH